MLQIKVLNMLTLGGNEDNGIQKESKQVCVILILHIHICIKQRTKISTIKYSG